MCQATPLTQYNGNMKIVQGKSGESRESRVTTRSDTLGFCNANFHSRSGKLLYGHPNGTDDFRNLSEYLKTVELLEQHKEKLKDRCDLRDIFLFCYYYLIIIYYYPLFVLRTC